MVRYIMAKEKFLIGNAQENELEVLIPIGIEISDDIIETQKDIVLKWLVNDIEMSDLVQYGVENLPIRLINMNKRIN